MPGIGLLLVLTACDGGTEPPPPPTTGTVQVIARTDGLGLDLDGYTVTLDQTSPQSVSINDTIHFTASEALPAWGPVP